MKVDEICTRSVKSCAQETSLADAANLMWEADCGVLPVLDEAGRVIGVVTDRDICMALALISQPAADVPVRVLLRLPLHTCRPSDEIREALRTMRTERVRRLPVVDGAGILQGMLSFNDLALAAKPERLAGPSDVTDEDLMLALKTIGAHRRAAASPMEPVSSTTTMV